MKLFTKEIDKKLAAQYHLGADLNAQVVVAKIFNPYGNGRWYLINSDPSDPDYLWAIVQIGDIVEVGSVSRKELENLRVGRLRFPLERDLGFSQRNAQEVYNGVISGKTYAKGGMADVTPTYAAGGEISPETLTKFAEDLQQAESEAYDNLDIRSGGQLYRTPSLQKQYASAMNQAFAELTKKHAHLKDINVENGQTIYDMLEDQNYHSLNNYLALKGVFGTKYKQKYEGYHTKYPDNYLDPANMVGAQSYAVGGLTPGRWYKDNQGVEYKFIGKIDNGPNKDQLLFTDGTQKMYKPLDDFGEKPKENKLFGWFGDGGEIDLFEHYEDIPPHVKKVLDKYNEGLEEGDYKTLEKAKNELESIGYTFDYDLGGGAYNLHKMEEGDSMSGYMGDGGEINDYYVIVKMPKGLVTKKDFDGMSKKEIIDWCEDRGWKYNLKGEKLGGQVLKEYEFFVKKPTKYNAQLPKNKMADGGSVHFEKIWSVEKNGSAYKVGPYTYQEAKEIIDDEYRNGPSNAYYRIVKYNSGHMADGGELTREERKNKTYFRVSWDDGEKVNDEYFTDNKTASEKYYNLIKKGEAKVAFLDKDSFNEYGWQSKHETLSRYPRTNYAKGGTTKFSDKVKSIQSSLLKRKKVAPSVQKDYGKTYNKAEAKEAATRIVGAMTAKERLMAKKKK